VVAERKWSEETMSRKSPKKVRSAKLEADVFECANCRREMAQPFAHHAFGVARISARVHLCEDCNSRKNDELTARRERGHFKPLVGGKVVRVDESNRLFSGRVVIIENGERRWALHGSVYLGARGLQVDEIDLKDNPVGWREED